MALALNTDEAGRSRDLYANKDLADVLLVISTQPAAVKDAVRLHLGRLEGAAPEASEGPKKAKRARTQRHAAAEPLQPMQWPDSCVMLQLHSAHLYKWVHKTT